MKVKELQKTVYVAWSPEEVSQTYLATGSAAQQLDSNGNSFLEIYSMNLNKPDYDLELKASLPSQYRFQKLIWSPTGHNSNHPNGLLVGGCEKGYLTVYSASQILDGEDGLICVQDSHSGTVRGLDFNPFQTNLLASVASESEIFVWDLNNTATHMTPGTRTQPLEDVQNVAWNRQVQHILASVFSSRCVIWDLRKNEQIIKLSDTQSRVRWHAVQWHPDVATHIWLASEEDQSPVVQMWDLRYATAPAKSMKIHQRGVLGMSCCSQDSDMMVSCGKDNRIYCWNPNTSMTEGDILCEVAVTPQWYSDVQWCPKNPALIASSSLEGNVSIYSLFGGSHQEIKTSNNITDSFPGIDKLEQTPKLLSTNQVTYSDPSKPPKWMKKPSGVKFGFGGKLLSFGSQSKSVQIQQIVTEPSIVELAEKLVKALNNGNLTEFCRNKADEVSNQGYRYIWYFLKANLEKNPKEEMLNLLGYNTEDMFVKFSKYLKDEFINHNVEDKTNRFGALTHEIVTEDHNLVANKNSKPVEEEIGNMSINFPVKDKNDFESLISEAIITGNIHAAVELCFETDRPVEALAVASTAGNEFFTKTQERFLKKHDCELSNIILALVTRKWMNFVSNCNIDAWKKALVGAIKHSDRKLVHICEKLGDRLVTEKSEVEYTKSAILCYICAGSIEKVIRAWYQLKHLEKENMDYELDKKELQELAEIVIILIKSLKQQGIDVEPEGKLAQFVFQYGTFLVEQGAINLAIAYVFALGPSTLPELNELRDRLNIASNRKSDTNTTDKSDVIKSNYKPQQPSESVLPNYLPSGVIQTTFNPTEPVGNQWNLSPPVSLLPAQVSRSVNIFNSSLQTSNYLNPRVPQNISQATKPPTTAQINENLMHPPRPSSVSSQGSPALPSRSKYVLDPSVSSGPQYGGSYNQIHAISQTNFNTMSAIPSNTFYQSTPSQIDTVAPIQSNYMSLNSMRVASNIYLTGVTQTETVHPPTQMQKNPTPPPGWNDPPVLKTKKQEANRIEQTGSAITHPIFGIDPIQNAYLNNVAHYQQNPADPPQCDPNVPFTTVHPNMYQTQHTGYQEKAVTDQQSELEKHKIKVTLPEEFIYMQTVFEELKTQCLSKASDTRTKRKFADVTKRLQNLYECLKGGRLTSNTIEALNQIVQYVQIGDYANALATHTSIAFGTDFAQTASFMPGIKVLILSAADLKVLLR